MSLFVFFISLPSYAYIGPGMGGGVIAITLGFIAAFFLAIFGILYYPIKRALNNRRNNKKAAQKSKDDS
jgi:hypothetical protein